MFEFYRAKAIYEYSVKVNGQAKTFQEITYVNGIVRDDGNKVGKIFRQHPEIEKCQKIKVQFYKVGA